VSSLYGSPATKVKDCFVACVDGLTGLPDALKTIFPRTQVQLWSDVR